MAGHCLPCCKFDAVPSQHSRADAPTQAQALPQGGHASGQPGVRGGRGVGRRRGRRRLRAHGHRARARHVPVRAAAAAPLLQHHRLC